MFPTLARLRARWFPSSAPRGAPLPDLHAMARQGDLAALVQAWSRLPRPHAARDGMDQTPLGAALTGWGGSCAPWSRRRQVAAWIACTHPPGTALPLQLRDLRHPLELLAAPDVDLANALSAGLATPGPGPALDPAALRPGAAARAWRHALGLGAQAATVADLAAWLAWLRARGVDLSGPASGWVLQALGNSRLGPAWAGHPGECFRALEDAGVAMGSNLLRLLEPRAGHGMGDVLVLGRALGQWPFARPLRGFDPAHWRSLEKAARWLSHYGQPVDWIEPLAARFRFESLEGVLEPAAPVAPSRPRL